MFASNDTTKIMPKIKKERKEKQIVMKWIGWAIPIIDSVAHDVLSHRKQFISNIGNW